MSLTIDNNQFKRAGGALYEDSTLRFVRSKCCDQIGVEDTVDGRVFYDHSKLTSSVRPTEDAPCQNCGELHWEWEPADDLEDYPSRWEFVRSSPSEDNKK